MSDKLNLSTSSSDDNMSEATGTIFGDKIGQDVNVLNSLLKGANFDAGTVTYPSATQEVYTFRNGGVAGSAVATITLNYTDSTKDNLLNWAKT